MDTITIILANISEWIAGLTAYEIIFLGFIIFVITVGFAGSRPRK